MGPQLCGLMLFRQGLRERSTRLAAPAHAMKRLTIAIAMLIAAAVGAPMADASTRQLTVMQDDVQVRGATDRTLDEFDRLGIDIVKVNLYCWLSPQRSKGVPVSPSIYRKLYLAGHRGLRASDNGGDTILIGELMPRGGTDQRKVPPLQFLREMACLDGNYRQYRGRAAKLRGCSRVGRIPTSGFAYHPYTLAGGPSVDEARDDAAIGQLGRVRATLDKLARRGKLPRRLKIWITEFGYQTRPPDPFGTPIGRAPNLMDLSEWIAFRNPRVASYAQYTLRDNDFWQSGLRRENGRPKRRVYEAFRMPLFVRSLGRNRVEVFGALRSALGGSARVESKAPGGRYRSRGSASVNRAGYFRRIFRVTNAVRHTFRVTLDGRSRTKRVTR